MALANCAFIAAMNGQRVLVMDWDLEAPGLPYYFRGLIDQRGASIIRNSAGVLDLFWQWRISVRGAIDADGLNESIEPFRNQSAFKNWANPLVEPNRLPKGAKLDVVTAGSATIDCPSPTSYAEALSRFNWTEFFEEEAGGILIDELRRWCLQHYDLVLIDSRTGLADVAGICTMQIPDSVYLCFVLNRQNIEGSARVASSIVASRGDEISVRTIPMRVSKDRPTEEADARARALREFKRAQLPMDRVETDLKTLSVPTSIVPYYEALEPFTSGDHGGDLSWAYWRLTESLLERDLPILKVDRAWNDEVRARLQPTITTVEYLGELEDADPDRAIEEIERFLDGALDADPSLELDREYVRALVAATVEVVDRSWEVDRVRLLRVENKTLDLLEQMQDGSDGDWRMDLALAAEQFDFGFDRSSTEQLSRTARIERVLSRGEQDAALLLRRAQNSIEMAVLLKETQQFPKAQAAVEKVEDLAAEAQGLDADPEQIAYVRAAVADIKARIAISNGDFQTARHYFEALLTQTANWENRRLALLGAEALMSMAEISSDDQARTGYLMKAIEMQPRVVLRDIDRLAGTVNSLLHPGSDPGTALRVAQALFKDSRATGSLPYGRTSEATKKFGAVANQLVRFMRASDPEESVIVLDRLGVAATRTLRGWTSGAGRITSDRNDSDVLLQLYEKLAERLQLAGCSRRMILNLRGAISGARIHDQDGEP